MWGNADNFFVITSENVCQINKSHIFGYFITKNRFYKNCDLENDGEIIEKEGYGQYIHIKKNESDIQVSWDDTGSVCLYVYEDDDYWAFSNSFWLLCDEVTREHQITLDERFAMHYVNVTLASLSIKNTLAKEIKVVPMYSMLCIKGTRLSITQIRREIHRCSIDSKEGLAVIDGWIEDWAHMIHMVAGSGSPLSVDLSGGFDSRVSFSLAMASGIDFNAKNINVVSAVPATSAQIRKHAEDLDIANKICGYYGIELNKGIDRYDTKSLTGKQDFDLTWHSMLALHKETYFRNKYYMHPCFRVRGCFGELVRGKVWDFDTWLSMTDMHGVKEFDTGAYWEVLNSIRKVTMGDDLPSRHTGLVDLYKHTWGRYHFGLTTFQNSCINLYDLNPLSDSRLLQISPLFRDNIGTDLIYAVIIMRTCPELLDFPFAAGECFSEETLYMAEKITSGEKIDLKFSNEVLDFSGLKEPEFEEQSDMGSLDAVKILEEMFRDKTNKEAFIDRFGYVGEKLYNKTIEEYSNGSALYPLSQIVPIVAIMRMLQYERESSIYKNRIVLQRQQNAILNKYIKEYPDSNRLKLRSGEYVQQILKQKNIRKIGVYGAGGRGKWFCGNLQYTDIEIVFVTDRNPNALLPGYKVIAVDEEFPQVDAIIVTPDGYFEEIKKTLLKKDKTFKLINLDELTR